MYTKSACLIASNPSSKDLDDIFQTEGHTSSQVRWHALSLPTSWQTEMGKLTLTQEFSLGNTVRPNLKKELDIRCYMIEFFFFPR